MKVRPTSDPAGKLQMRSSSSVEKAPATPEILTDLRTTDDSTHPNKHTCSTPLINKMLKSLSSQITSSVPRRCALAPRHGHRLPPLRAVFVIPPVDVDTLVSVAGGQFDMFVASANTQLNDPQLISKITSQPDVVKLYRLALEQPLVTLGIAGATLWAIPRILSVSNITVHCINMFW